MTVKGPPRPAFTLDVEADPIPWLTDQFRAAGAFETQVPTLDPDIEDALKGVLGGKAPKVVFSHNMPTLRAMSAALGITSSIVTALSDHEKRFGVRFHPTAQTASTYLKTREVVIGIRPMLDPRLTEGQRAALMVALAYHEVGHVIWTADMQNRVLAKYGESNKPALKVFNVVHDLLLEAQQQVTFPGYAPTLRVKQAYWGKRWVVRLNAKRNRFGALVQATLYPQGSDWSTTPEVSDWFTWADDWAKRCRDIKAGKSPTYLFGLIDEAIEHLRLDEPDVFDPTEEEEERPDTGEHESDEEQDEQEPSFDEDDDGEGDMDDPFGDDDDTSGPSGEEPPVWDDEDDDDSPPGEDEDDDPKGDTPTDDTEESDEDTEEEDEDKPKGSAPTGQDPDEDEADDESDEDDEGVPGEDEGDDEDDESDEESDKGGTGNPGDIDPEEEAQPDEPRDEFDDPRIPQAHPEGDEDAAEWQGRIDDFERVQVKGRDKLVVGGGSFAKREVRIIRIDR